MLDGIAAKCVGLVDLLLRSRYRHVDHPMHPEITADIGNALCVVSGAGANKDILIWFSARTLRIALKAPQIL